MPQSYLFFFALRRLRVRRRHSLQVLLMFKLVIYLIFRFSSDTDVNPFTPISDSYSHHCEYMFRYFFSPRCFLWGRHADLGEVDWCFVRVSSSDFLVFFVAQVVNGRWKTQNDQTKALWRLEPRVRVPHHHILFESLALQICSSLSFFKKKDFVESWSWFWCSDLLPCRIF